MMNNAKKVNVLFVIFAAIISCFIGFLNGYPLVYSDTGTYIDSGFRGIIPDDRPIFYGLFIRHVSLYTSLWLVIFVQALLISYLIYITLGMFFTGMRKNYIFLGIILFLTFCTGYSFIVSILLPDIFSSLAILCFINLILNNRLNKVEIVFVAAIFLFSICTHLSNIPIFILLFIFLLFFLAYKRIRREPLLLNIKRLYLCVILFTSTLVVIPVANYFHGNKFQISNGSHVFIMNHLLETGILQDYLNDACKSSDYKICKYKDSLGGDFMWNNDSPLYKTGGWTANKYEYNKIITDIMTTPRYMLQVIQKAIEYSFKQYFTFDITVFPPQLENSAPYGQIMWRFGNTKKEYISSLQNQSMLNFAIINKIEKILILISMAFLYFILIYPSKFRILSSEIKWILLIVLVHGIISSVICSNLSTLHARFQNRIVWLLPFLAIIAIANYIGNRNDLIRNVQNEN